jgi:hypothetical protein
MNTEQDPLKLVVKGGGAPRVNAEAPVLAEVLRKLRSEVEVSGTGRIQGSELQNLFSAPPYGWTKDTVRYLFAALLRAGEVEFHLPGAEDPIKTQGRQAAEAVKSTMAFKNVGVSLRDSKPQPEALEKASRRLESLFGEQVLPLEEHISSAVRKHVPELRETISSLPDRLNLLDLAGADRARQLKEDLDTLMKADAGGAASILGGDRCSLPDEINWAKSVSEVLESEDDIRRAQSVLESVAGLEAMIPEEKKKILSGEDKEAIQEILDSETFYEKLPELRAIVRVAEDRAKAGYEEEMTRYKVDLSDARKQLESDPDWVKLMEEDREELAGKIVCDLPEAPREGEEIQMLQTLLVRRRMLPGLVRELKEEMKKRRPVEPEPLSDQDEETTEEVVDAETLLPSGEIRSSEDLERWLSDVRARLEVLLESNKRIRIRSRS